MLFDDTYKTIEVPAEGLFRDRGSKFYAFAYPVLSDDAVKQHLTDLREAHPKAVHFCYAYRFGTDRNVYRSNDDGEPTGSAGKPILNVLYSFDLTNVLVVVVRYWGGTLLGIPGLINAYKTATEDALQRAAVVEKTVKDVYKLAYRYDKMNEVMRVAKDFDLKIVAQQFDNECVIEVEVRKLLLNKVMERWQKIPDLAIGYLRTV
jgi:uncharacterized YigZ family protein